MSCSTTSKSVYRDPATTVKQSKSQRLSDSIDNGDRAALEELLKEGVDINRGLFFTVTPLMAASMGGDPEIVRMLLEYGTDTELRSQNETALHLAAKYKKPESVRVLLEKGANIEAIGQFEKTAFHYAAIESGPQVIEVMKVLLEYEADKEARDEYGATPLLRAVSSSDIEVVRFLLDNGANKEARDKRGRTTLIAASSRELDDYEMVSIFLDAGVDKNARDFTEFGSVPNNTALDLAVYNDNPNVVRLLLSEGIDIKQGGYHRETALHAACSNKQKNKLIVQLLLSAGIDIRAKNRLDNTALHTCSRTGNPKVVRLLLENGADQDLEARIHYWLWTPLFLAVRNGHHETVKVLLEFGANTEVKDRDGKTIWDFAKHDSVREVLEEWRNPQRRKSSESTRRRSFWEDLLEALF